MSKVAEFYDGYSDRQQSAGINRRHWSIDQWLVRFGLQDDQNVLEIGCGVGTMTKLLCDRVVNGRILANDISAKSVELARAELSNYKNVEFIVGDMVRLDIDEKFDVILLPDVLEHIPISDHPALFKKLASLLSPTGMIVIHIPDPNYLAWRYTQENDKDKMQIIDQSIYTDQLTADLYPTGLYITHLETYNLHVENGDYQIIQVRKSKPTEYPALQRETPFSTRVVNKIKRTIS
ncbi:MAG: class I SAM-dependent methyltransferase [Flavobacteriales bacterium]|jgi:trans-aconitate 2-methyltransferase|nr:class I SAM-dependent methyltransferase [Flavobacteriales bacterium]